MDTVKLLEVVVATVEYIVSICLIGNFLHGLGVIDRSSGDVIEGWHLCFQIIEDMSLDTAFLLADQAFLAHHLISLCHVTSLDMLKKATQM